MPFGLIRDARIEECAACERKFDLNYYRRMEGYQTLHAGEQLHFWPCGLLERDFSSVPYVWADLHDTPWDRGPREVFFHNERCEEAYCLSGSFDYIDCESCGRTVCEQNPANGWHVQFREHVDLGYVCLRCYETEILSNGQPREDFEGSKIDGGMFFSWGNLEPKGAGFEEVTGFVDYFVNGAETAKPFNRHALSLIDSGLKVITGYERLAIGGLEGYITMFAKKGSG
ncbi:MAG: hypothetical protein L0338_36770 [Acidobacteria bacterium]|nr:hypothetical protein [Acidobacteriota bacterium]